VDLKKKFPGQAFDKSKTVLIESEAALIHSARIDGSHGLLFDVDRPWSLLTKTV
jgi:hypothetical protein